MSNTYYKPGDWNAHCDVCNFRFKASQMRKRWDGLMVCKKDFEQDHPQKYLRVTERAPTVPWVRKQSDSDSFGPYVCYLYARSAYADLAEANCAIADNTQYTYAFLYDLKNAHSG
jgi:hypothetical protein